jgi:hypothetical protein
MKVQLIGILLFILPTLALSQNYELEWQSTPGANIPNALLNNDGYPPGALDFDGDGVNELVTIQQISGSPVLVIINGANPQIVYKLLDENGQPFFPIQNFKFRGFYDIEADSNKTLVMFAKMSPDFVTMMNLSGVNTPNPSGNWSCDSLPFVVAPLTVKNIDGDAQYEVITYNPDLQRIQVFGEGYTPGLQGPDDPYSRSLLDECAELFFEWVSPPNVSWPGNIDLLPNDGNDLNRDGNDDLIFTLLDSFIVYSPYTQSFLLQTEIPDDLQIAYENVSPRFIAFADMCGAPARRYMIVGKPKNGNPNTPLNQLTNIAAIDLTAPDVDGNPWLRDTYLYVNNLIIDEGSNPENWRLRAITDMDNDGEEEIIMQNINNRRIAMIGLGDGEGLTTLPVDGLNAETVINDKQSGLYSLVLKLETEPNTEAFLVDRNLYREAELDLNSNGIPDLLIWQEAEGDTTAFGCKVFDLEQNEVIWSFDFPAGQLGDSLRVFHGFHDVNADGEKEVFLGKFTAVTQDGTAHLPFGEDFQIISILDMDGDDFPDVLGFTSDNKLQVWGVDNVNSIEEAAHTVGFQAMAFPNPTQGEHLQLKLSLKMGGDYSVTLYDLYGRQLDDKHLGKLNAGSHQFSLTDWHGLSSGTYCLTVRGPDGELPLLIQIID